jgi:hypothetical protein
MQKLFDKIELLLIAVLIPTFGLGCSNLRETPRTEDVKANSTPRYKATLGIFQNLKGTPYLMSAVTSNAWRSDQSSSYDSSGSSGETRNLVFLDANSLASHRLFDTNGYIITQTDQYTQKVNDKDVTQWLVHQVLKGDTNGNKRLDRNDLRTFAISSANGKGYAEVITGITEIFGLTMVNSGKLVVVYRKNKAKTASIIDLEKRAIASTQPVVELGPEIK